MSERNYRVKLIIEVIWRADSVENAIKQTKAHFLKGDTLYLVGVQVEAIDE